MTAQTTPVPKAIQVFADRIAEEIDVPVASTIEHVHGHRWRVTIESARVRMWVEWEVHSRGRLQWGQSDLFVDGVQVARATSYAGLLSTFNDPDGTGTTAEPEPVTPIEVDPATAPPRVLATYHLISKKPLPGARITVTRAGRQWTVAVVGDRFEVGFRFVAALMNPTRPLVPADVVPDKTMPISLVIDGVDRSAEVKGRADKALAMVTHHAAEPPPPPVAAPSDVKTTATSVVTRQQKVIRR